MAFQSDLLISFLFFHFFHENLQWESKLLGEKFGSNSSIRTCQLKVTIMLFLFLLFSLSNSRTADSEYVLYPQNNRKIITKESNFKFKHSENGFVTTFTGDNYNSTEFIKLYVLGYNCITLAPHIDRILLIPTDYSVPNNKLHHLASVWNIILRVNNLHSDCFEDEKMDQSKQIWFRLVAQKLTMYNKLLYVGHDIIFVNNPEQLFSYPTPAAPIDYQSWGFTYFGIAHNFDLFLFSPNENSFNELINLSCKWAEFPLSRSSRFTTNSLASIGPYDNGLFHEYFGKEVMTFPPYANIEVGPEAFYNKISYEDLRIISFRFLISNPPWLGSTYADVFWKVVAEQAFKYRKIHFTQLGKPKESELITRSILIC